MMTTTQLWKKWDKARPRSRGLTQHAVSVLLTRAPEPVRTFLTLLSKTGLRAREAANLRWRDIKSDGTVNLFTDNAEKVRSIYLPKECRESIEALRAQRPTRKRPGRCRQHVFGANSDCPHQGILAAASHATKQAGCGLPDLRHFYVRTVLAAGFTFPPFPGPDLFSRYAHSSSQPEQLAPRKLRKK